MHIRNKLKFKKLKTFSRRAKEVMSKGCQYFSKILVENSYNIKWLEYRYWGYATTILLFWAKCSLKSLFNGSTYAQNVPDKLRAIHNKRANHNKFFQVSFHFHPCHPWQLKSVVLKTRPLFQLMVRYYWDFKKMLK